MLGESPYRVDRDGASYVPVGDGGIVLGLELGDSVFKLAADHAAPGACLMHPMRRPGTHWPYSPASGTAVWSGPARRPGAVGCVIGKRGEAGRVIVGFAPQDWPPCDRLTRYSSDHPGRAGGRPACRPMSR